ncbi:MAG: SH3 domain-containing protein, partial [Bacillota bacterium]|nr:SH3 domain-containing protein [Bacillota bacterium]
MRKKLFILFFVFVVSISGCGKSGKTGNSNIDSIGSNAVTNNWQNVGVITDTVVDVFKDSTIQSNKITQVLYNQPVNIIDTKESWFKIETIDGTIGWIKSRYVSKNTSSVDKSYSGSKIIVTVKRAQVLSLYQNGALIKDVVMGTEFYVIDSYQDWYEIALPDDDTGWISESGTIHMQSDQQIGKTTADSFVATALKFKGTVYQTGGISSWGGIDSSGLTYMCSRINGVQLPRSVEMQYKSGEVVVVTKKNKP